MQKHTCLCLQCGKSLELVLEDGVEINDQSCPLCKGKNLVQHNPASFYNMFFGGGG